MSWSAYQHVLRVPTAGSPNVLLSQATAPLRTLETLAVAVPYRTSRVPVNEHVWYSVAHCTQLMPALDAVGFVGAGPLVVTGVAAVTAVPDVGLVVVFCAAEVSAPILPPPQAVATAAQSSVKEIKERSEEEGFMLLAITGQRQRWSLAKAFWTTARDHLFGMH